MLYLDTSLLVAALPTRPKTQRMQSWLGRQDVDELAISDWVATEFSSALSIKLRTGRLEPLTGPMRWRYLLGSATDSLTIVAVSRLQFRTAARSLTNMSWACARETLCISPSGPIVVRRFAPSTGG